jgi:hypothetical protein
VLNFYAYYVWSVICVLHFILDGPSENTSVLFVVLISMTADTKFHRQTCSFFFIVYSPVTSIVGISWLVCSKISTIRRCMMFIGF